MESAGFVASTRESFGEVLAAIPFNWEVVPGRPKLQQQSSMMNNSATAGSIKGGGGGGGGANAEVFQQQQEQQVVSNWRANHEAAEFVRKMPLLSNRNCRPLASKSTSAFNLSPHFQEEIVATSMSVGNIKPDDNFIIGQLLPLPPRLRTPAKQHHRNPSAPVDHHHSSDAAAGNISRRWRGTRFDEMALEPRLESCLHRRTRSLHALREAAAVRPAFGKDSAANSLEFATCGDLDGSKLVWPFLKDKIRWSSQSARSSNNLLQQQRHHHHHQQQQHRHRLSRSRSSSNFDPQNVAPNKLVDHSKENVQILDFFSTSPHEQHTHQNGPLKSMLHTKETKEVLAIPSGPAGSFRKLAAVTTSGSKAKPSSRTSSHFSTRSPAAVIPHDDSHETQIMPAARDIVHQEEPASHHDHRAPEPGRSYSISKGIRRSRTSSTSNSPPSCCYCFTIVSSPILQSCHGGFHGLTPGYESP
jgi:hypothetical protein